MAGENSIKTRQPEKQSDVNTEAEDVKSECVLQRN